MSHLTRAFVIVFLPTLPILAQTPGLPQPAIYISHSATRRAPQTAAAGLAPGSLFDVNVSNLYAPFGPLKADDPVTLQFRAPGASDAHDLTIVSSLGPRIQFTAIVPANTPVGQATVLAIAASGASFSATAWIAASDFGLFTKAGSGFDAAATQVGLTTPAHAGDWITLWGTGLGSADASSISVEVAGISVPPSYAGAAPGLPGVDQINFQFPQSVPDDCYVPIAVRAAGVAGNTVSIAAASAPGACHHRLGLSANDLATLDRGGSLSVSQSWVHSDVLPTPDNSALYRRTDIVSLDFIQYNAALIQSMTGLLNYPSTGCGLNAVSGSFIFSLINPVDAGTPLVVGPGGVRLTMTGMGPFFSTTPSTATYPLDAVPPSMFTAGDWSIQVPGGKDIAAFQAALRVAPPLHWTNRNTVSPIARTSDLTLTWDPTGYTDHDWMQGSIGVGAGAAICRVPASSGSVTIPASLIAQLPAPPTTSTGLPMVELLLSPSSDALSLYSVPMAGGGSIHGVATYSYLETIWAQFQ